MRRIRRAAGGSSENSAPAAQPAPPGALPVALSASLPASPLAGPFAVQEVIRRAAGGSPHTRVPVLLGSLLPAPLAGLPTALLTTPLAGPFATQRVAHDPHPFLIDSSRTKPSIPCTERTLVHKTDGFVREDTLLKRKTTPLRPYFAKRATSFIAFRHFSVEYKSSSVQNRHFHATPTPLRTESTLLYAQHRGATAFPARKKKGGGSCGRLAGYAGPPPKLPNRKVRGRGGACARRWAAGTLPARKAARLRATSPPCTTPQPDPSPKHSRGHRAAGPASAARRSKPSRQPMPRRASRPGASRTAPPATAKLQRHRIPRTERGGAAVHLHAAPGRRHIPCPERGRSRERPARGTESLHPARKGGAAAGGSRVALGRRRTPSGRGTVAEISARLQSHRRTPPGRGRSCE